MLQTFLEVVTCKIKYYCIILHVTTVLMLKRTSTRRSLKITTKATRFARTTIGSKFLQIYPKYTIVLFSQSLKVSLETSGTSCITCGND